MSRLQAYADYNDLMDLTEKLISEMVAELNNGSHVIRYHANGPEEDPVTIDFSPPWRRISMISGLEEALGVKFPIDLASDEAQEFLSKLVGPAWTRCSINTPHTCLYKPPATPCFLCPVIAPWNIEALQSFGSRFSCSPIGTIAMSINTFAEMDSMGQKEPQARG